MSQIEWSENLSLGLPSIDHAHQILLQEVNQLASLPDSELSTHLFSLIKALESDFVDEEQLMEQSNYPDIRLHRELHARVLSALHRVVPFMLNNEFAPVREITELLPSWLVMHMMTVDKVFTSYLQAQSLAVCRT